MNISIRTVIESDLLIFFEQQSDPVANQMAAFPARDFESFMAHWKKILADDASMIRTILYNGHVAGNVLSFNMEDHREVGYWLGRDFWGRGIASAALREFLTIETTRPLYGYVVKHNIGSRRVLEKCGFTLLHEEGNDFVLKLA